MKKRNALVELGLGPASFLLDGELERVLLKKTPPKKK